MDAVGGATLPISPNITLGRRNTQNVAPFQSYPDPSDFDEELYSRLHELPDGGRINLEWVRSHVWRGADKFSVPRERVVRGMQANMFWIVAEDAEGREKRSVVGKRIMPRELPPKVCSGAQFDCFPKIFLRNLSENLSEILRISERFPEIFLRKIL